MARDDRLTKYLSTEDGVRCNNGLLRICDQRREKERAYFGNASTLDRHPIFDERLELCQGKRNEIRGIRECSWRTREDQALVVSVGTNRAR